jgi:sugar transferase EpsL
MIDCRVVAFDPTQSAKHGRGVVQSRMFNRFYRRVGKRLLDLAMTIPAVVVLLPVILLTALTIRLRMGAGVFYCDQRGGLHGKTFTLWKFRTMLATVDSQGHLLPDEQRLTRLGNWLRKLSLDELPQLWNVLRGDISLIGPRPLLARYLPRYSPEQARRHEVRPGLSGWAQINGRNTISWEEKFQLDVWYVDHLSFWLDLKIILRTIWLVLCRSNISASGHATMPEFAATEPQGFKSSTS